MKLDILLKDISDQYVKDGFYRLMTYLREQKILEGDWRFFEVEFQAGTKIPFKHGLSFVPRDVVLLSIVGDYNFYFNHADADSENIYVTAAGPCRVRFLLGRFEYKAYGITGKDLPFVAPNSGSGPTPTGDVYLTHSFTANGPYTEDTAIDGYFILPFACTLEQVHLFNEIAPTGTIGSQVRFDILKKELTDPSFTSVLTTVPRILSGAANDVWWGISYGGTGLVQPVLTNVSTVFPANTAFRFDVLTIISDTAPMNAKVELVFKKV